jgi:hypothetical protein
MGKAIGILLVVLGIWVGLEVYMEGVQGAFGGRLAFLGSEDGPPPEEHRWAGERAADAFESARDRRIDRIEQQAGER